MYQRLRTILAAGGLALAAMTLATPAYAAGLPPAIQPDQFFTAVVNGEAGVAQIAVFCQAGVGHPFPGQTVEVLPVAVVPTDRDGFTGSRGERIDVFLSRAAATPALQLTRYETPVVIPSSTVAPCGGTDVVTFTPVAGSDTARPAVVKVTFVVKPTPFG